LTGGEALGIQVPHATKERVLVRWAPVRCCGTAFPQRGHEQDLFLPQVHRHAPVKEPVETPAAAANESARAREFAAQVEKILRAASVAWVARRR
jgi:hypothetical protein